jgi:acyl dehydratase
MIAAGPGEFGGSEWTQVTQHEVDRLADLTGDHSGSILTQSVPG